MLSLVLEQLFVVLLPMLLSASGKGKANTFKGLDLVRSESRLLWILLTLLVVLAKLDDPLVEVLVLFIRGLDIDIASVGAVKLKIQQQQQPNISLNDFSAHSLTAHCYCNNQFHTIKRQCVMSCSIAGSRFSNDQIALRTNNSKNILFH